MLVTNPIAAEEKAGLVNDTPKQMSQLAFLVHLAHCRVTGLHDLVKGVQQSPFGPALRPAPSSRQAWEVVCADIPVTKGPLEFRLVGVLQGRPGTAPPGQWHPLDTGRDDRLHKTLQILK